VSQGDDIVAALEKELARVVRETTLETTALLVEHTPVDTSFARSSWVPSIGQVVEVSLLPTDEKGSPGAAAAAQQQGQAQIISYQLGDGPVFITNQTRYINRLNGGSSTQEPAGFVERAVAQGQQTAQERADARKVKL
jgi:hypothetical protein